MLELRVIKFPKPQIARLGLVSQRKKLVLLELRTGQIGSVLEIESRTRNWNRFPEIFFQRLVHCTITAVYWY